MAVKHDIYFDYNATCPLLPKVKEAMLEIIDQPLNPSSIHSFGRKAKMIVDMARTRIANLMNADDRYQVIFTSSGTESNNMALKGFKDYRVLTSTIEHPSVLAVVGEGIIPVDEKGIVKLKILDQILKSSSEPTLVSIQAANNETGVIQPLEEIIKIVHNNNALFHTDAVQAFGKIAFDASILDADLITISGHKFGGPIGAAALVFKKNLPLLSLMQGGGQEYRFRPGTQNCAAIHGFGIAAEIAVNSLIDYGQIQKLRDHFENSISKAYSEAVFFGHNANRLPNTSLVAMKSVANETQLIYFDLNKVSLSAGSACSSGKVDFPHILLAMNVDPALAKTALRLSLGRSNTKEEVDLFIKLWLDFAAKQFLN